MSHILLDLKSKLLLLTCMIFIAEKHSHQLTGHCLDIFSKKNSGTPCYSHLIILTIYSFDPNEKNTDLSFYYFKPCYCDQDFMAQQWSYQWGDIYTAFIICECIKPFITFQLLKFVSWKRVAQFQNNIKSFKVLITFIVQRSIIATLFPGFFLTIIP